MAFCWVKLRGFIQFFRRHGAMSTSAAIVAAVLIALAASGLTTLQAGDARLAEQAVAANVERANAVLTGQQRGLDAAAQLAADGSDAAVRQFLEQLTTLLPGVRGAAVTDRGGGVQLRSAGRLDETTLAGLAADATRRTAADSARATAVSQTLRDGETGDPLVAIARALPGADGAVVLIVDASAFAGLDLVRQDGTPLFADEATGAAGRTVGDFPVRLAVSAGEGPAWAQSALYAAYALVGLAALLGLLVIGAARLRTEKRRVAWQANVERELRKELAIASAAANRTDELNRTKSRFFAQVTHELRTPLNAILGFAETIRQQMFGPVANPRYVEYAGLIQEAGTHLLSLINDLLDNARIEAGKMEITPIRMSAPALARSALDLVELLADERSISLTTAGLASCPDLNVDARAMKQVLVNLLSNAVKYTPAGGRIELRFAPRDDGGASIAISDTGIGMSAEDVRVAFEPFGRAGDMQARRQQGTGLGLSLARALVRLHGGDLSLVSQLDFGTTATILLPASAVFAPSAPSKLALHEAA